MSRSLRILNIVGSFLPAYGMGGPAQTAFHLSKQIISMGHDVFVLTTDIDQNGRLDVPEGPTMWNGVPVCYCRYVKSPIPYYSPELGRRLRQMIGSFDIALINSSWTAYGVVSGRECRRANLPYVVYAHGSYAPRRLDRSRIRKRIWWLAFDKKLYRSASAIIALTQLEKKQLVSMGIDARISVIPNGIPIDWLDYPGILQHQDLDGLGPYFLFLGRIAEIKGLDLLLPSFSIVADQYPEVSLAIAGPDESGYIQDVDHLARTLGLENRIHIIGELTGEEKIGAFDKAIAFVLPSYGEGMSVAVLEAMARGCAVIVSDRCGMPEIASARAGYVVPLSKRELARAMDHVLSNPSEATRMGERGKKLVRSRYTWRSIAERTLELCRNVLQDHEQSKR